MTTISQSELPNTCYRCGRPTVSHLCDACTIPGGSRNGELAKAPAETCACCGECEARWPGLALCADCATDRASA